MCEQGIKDLVEKPTAQASRILSSAANKVGLQGVEDWSKENEKNPGRAVTKAAEATASWYAGNALGDYFGPASGAGAAGAGTDVATAAAQAGPDYAAELAQLNGAAGPGYAAEVAQAANPGMIAPGMQTQAMDESGLLNQGQIPNVMNSPQMQIKGLMQKPFTRNLMMRQGLQSLTPQQQPAPAPPPQRAPAYQPQSTPYGGSSSPYGGGGLPYQQSQMPAQAPGMGQLTPDQIQRLRAMGLI